MSSAGRLPWRGRLLTLLGIVLVAFSLRSAVASLSPVLDHIGRDFELSATVVGLIGTAPPVCYAVFGMFAPALARRFGLERFAIVVVVIVAAGLLARGLAGGAPMLLVATVVVFAGIGMGNILLPPLVKKYFPDRIGLLTTLYTTMMAVATLVPPLVAVPVADGAGWRVSLGMWALFSVLALLPWIALLVHRRGDDPEEGAAQPAGRVIARLWRLPLAWALAVGFAVSSSLAYTSFAWLPRIMTDTAGVSPAAAGVLLSLFGGMGLPCSLIVPLLVARFRIVGVLFAVAVVTGVTGLVGLLLAPAAAPGLWVALIGLTPLLFPLVLVMLGLRSRTHQTAVALSSFVQSVGYAIAALFPLLVGVLHDASGSWTPPLLLLLGVVAAAVPAGIVAARPRTIEDAWERRHGPW